MFRPELGHKIGCPGRGCDGSQNSLVGGQRAYSYVRFSQPEQSAGDSLRRQLERSREYAAALGLALDDSLRDLGVSAAAGRNRTTGALGEFLRAVERHDVPPGSHLIVESLDRLSREKPTAALRGFLDLIEAGITVRTLTDRQVYSEASIAESSMTLFGSLMVMVRAHEENAIKGDRVRSRKQQKVAAAIEHGTIMTASCPRWLEVVEDAGQRKFRALPDRVAVVRRMFELTAAGVGVDKLAKILNSEDVPPFSVGSKGWHAWCLKRIITGRAVLGELRPQRRNLTTNGERIFADRVIENYYPAVVTLAQWERANAARIGRRGTGGRRDKNITNLLNTLCYCASCGGRMRVRSKGKSYLVCDSNFRGLGCPNNVHYDYAKLEGILLERLGGLALDPSGLDTDAEARRRNDEITLLESEIARATKRSASLLLKANDDELSETIWTAVRELNQRRKEAETKVAALRKQLLIVRGADSVEEHQSAMLRVRDAAIAGNFEARARVAEGLRAVVDFALFTRERRSVLVSFGAMVAAHEFRDGEELASFFPGRARHVPNDWRPWLAKLPPGENDVLRKRRQIALQRAGRGDLVAQFPLGGGAFQPDRADFPLGGDGTAVKISEREPDASRSPMSADLDDVRRCTPDEEAAFRRFD